MKTIKVHHIEDCPNRQYGWSHFLPQRALEGRQVEWLNQILNFSYLEYLHYSAQEQRVIREDVKEKSHVGLRIQNVWTCPLHPTVCAFHPFPFTLCLFFCLE